MEIIDFHLHTGYDFQDSETGKSIDYATFKSDLLACGITRGCGSYINVAMNGRPVSEYETLIPYLNEKAMEARQVLGDFYLPGIHIHPNFVEMSCREIERYSKKGVRLIGELVPYMMGGFCFSSKAFAEIMDCAKDYGMTVSIHLSNGKAGLSEMYNLCESIPRELNLVWAHFSYGGEVEYHIDMLKKYKNVYFDISAHGSDRVGIIADAVKKVGSEKLLFGTDYPGIGPASDIAAVMFEDITDKDRENIFSLNAKRLLGI